MTHTKGPWKVSLMASLCVHPAGANGEIIASVSGSQPEYEANARLISVAPELLTALANLINSAEQGSEAIGLKRALDDGRHAIAKAEGR